MTKKEEVIEDLDQQYEQLKSLAYVFIFLSLLLISVILIFILQV